MDQQLQALTQSLERLVLQLQQEGVLDEQFSQLMQLQDASNPDFVQEVVQLYFEDSVQKIERVGTVVAAPQPDYNELDQIVHQFKGSSASLGASRIAQLCVKFREACQQTNQPTCQQLLAEIREAYGLLRDKLAAFVSLERQIKQLGNGGY
jgi:histidine-containing phosphotransfer protein